ncbi:hypothetical protein COY95_01005 [Candidatus Woesearchaeota archaeon CG_4_10_14_0_8_um_filter_47_5]|nr:MAG: hypothetical protein COY95_01005 [Candidatus Woesearchaeota archaeon CG_4_10_14_0_8_um_filter_47_5]
MEEHFTILKNRYDAYYKELLSQGKLPMRPTERGYWGAAISPIVFDLFKQLDLKRFSSFVDLGSGDGKVVMLASLFGTKAQGIESDEELHRTAVALHKELAVKVPSLSNAELVRGDYYEHDLSPYQVVFINPDQPFFRGMEKKLLKELNGYLIVYSHTYHPHELHKLVELTIDGMKIPVYVNKKRQGHTNEHTIKQAKENSITTPQTLQN